MLKHHALTLILCCTCGLLSRCAEPTDSPTQENLTGTNTQADEQQSLPAEEEDLANTADQPTGTQEGQSYFALTLAPALRENCQSCHASQVPTGTPQGPLSIYRYTDLLDILVSTTLRIDASSPASPSSDTSPSESAQEQDFSPFVLRQTDLPPVAMALQLEQTDSCSLVANSDLLAKLLNIASHGGGKQCASASTEICGLILEWWKLECPDSESYAGLEQLDQLAASTRSQDPASGTPSVEAQNPAADAEVDTPPDLSRADPREAAIVVATALGRLIGFAANRQSLDTPVQVEAYIGGDAATGELAGSATANQPGFNGGYPGQRQFTIDLADRFRDGQSREVFLYERQPGGELRLLNSEATQVTAYNFSEEGREFFETQLRASLNGCAGCHDINYEQQFYSLISPSPAEGGEAANNELFNKPSLSNGETHGGGRRCSTPSQSPCNLIQQWWDIEFGDLE